MARWFVVLQPISGRAGVTTVVADEVQIGVSGHLLLKTDDKIVAAIAPGTWVSVEKESVSFDLTHNTQSNIPTLKRNP